MPVEKIEVVGQALPHARPQQHRNPRHTWPVSIDDLTVARAEALFASGLSQWDSPAEAEVTAAISHALQAFGGIRGCAGEVAAAFGERPETAVARMRWAVRVAQLT